MDLEEGMIEPGGRERLVEVLIAHQRHSAADCLCGHRVIGASLAEHIADVYFGTCRAVMAIRGETFRCSGRYGHPLAHADRITGAIWTGHPGDESRSSL